MHLTLQYDNASLLLRLVQAHADSLEFDIGPDAQKRAFDAWLLAGRISDLVSDDSGSELVIDVSAEEAEVLYALVRSYADGLAWDVDPEAQRHAFDTRHLAARIAVLFDE